MTALLRFSIFLTLLIISVDIGIAVNVEVTVEHPGVQSRDPEDPDFEWMGSESFDLVKAGKYQRLKSCYNLPSCEVDGLYQAMGGTIAIKENDEVGRHLHGSVGGRYTIQLKTAEGSEINYFGYYHSAMQKEDVVRVYSKKKMLKQIGLEEEIRPLLNSDTNYDGNPNFDSKDTGTAPYVFVNIYCHDCTIDEIRFTNIGDTNSFRSRTDNHTVGMFKSRPKYEAEEEEPEDEEKEGVKEEAEPIGTSLETEAPLETEEPTETETPPPQETPRGGLDAVADKSEEKNQPTESNKDNNQVAGVVFAAVAMVSLAVGGLRIAYIRERNRCRRNGERVFNQIVSFDMEEEMEKKIEERESMGDISGFHSIPSNMLSLEMCWSNSYGFQTSSDINENADPKRVVS